MRTLRRLLLAGVTGALLSAAPAPAPATAALPAPGKSFEAHDHETPGRNWHVQLEMSARSGRSVETLVVYAEQCGVTAALSGVPVSAAGVIGAKGTAGGGRWQLDAAFIAPGAVEGIFRVVRGGCDTGPQFFRVTPAGDGHAHAPGAHNHGPKYPDVARADVTQTRQAIQLRRRVAAAAVERFSSYGAALAAGYVRYQRAWRRPLVFHLRHGAYGRDGRIFDARRPESLVYWWPTAGDPVLIGSMFRAPVGPRPAFAGPIPIYHAHSNPYGGAGTSQMTHVWLTGDLRSAWSNCLPVAELEAANPAFRYAPPMHGVSGPETIPCDAPAP